MLGIEYGKPLPLSLTWRVRECLDVCKHGTHGGNMISRQLRVILVTQPDNSTALSS